MADQKKYLQEKVRNSYIRNNFLNIWSRVRGLDNPELFLVLNLNDFMVMKADSLKKYMEKMGGLRMLCSVKKKKKPMIR